MFFSFGCMHCTSWLEFIVLIQQGLERRGYKEAGFLKEVDEVAGSSTIPFYGSFSSHCLLQRVSYVAKQLIAFA